MLIYIFLSFLGFEKYGPESGDQKISRNNGEQRVKFENTNATFMGKYKSLTVQCCISMKPHSIVEEKAN